MQRRPITITASTSSTTTTTTEPVASSASIVCEHSQHTNRGAGAVRVFTMDSAVFMILPVE
jgi:hypothetical protein